VTAAQPALHPAAPADGAAADGALRVGILGGGALGLAAALRLVLAGCRVTVFERETRLGGLAVGFRVGQSDLEKFYHHIFGTDTTVSGLIDELGLGHRLVWAHPDTSVLWGGRQAGLDSPADVLRFPFLPPQDRLRLAAALAVLKVAPDERPFAGQTAAAWIRRVMGRRVYAVLWEPLLRGKFGARAEEIAMSWFWSRIHERTTSLGYLRGGFQQLYDALGDRIRALGGRVLTETAATSLTAPAGGAGGGGGVAVETSGPGGATARHVFDRLLVTLPTPLFARLAGAPGAGGAALPPDWVARYVDGGPDHFAAHCAVLALDRPLLPPVYWLNINDPGYPFLAFVEHTNLMPAEDYGGRHLVYLGNYVPPNDRLMTESDGATRERMLAALPRLRPDFDPTWVTESWMFKAPYAQPIVTTDYPRRLPPHETPLPGVYLANMAHVYPQDRGQNYSLRLGQRMAQRILAGAARRWGQVGAG
jgi:protoporphyrinogen oxidase